MGKGKRYYKEQEHEAHSKLYHLLGIIKATFLPIS